MSKKLTYITYMYGIGTILVVFGHSHPLHGTYPAFLQQLTDFIYTFHMPLFFFISGILIQYTSDDRKIVPWWLKKVKKLMLPYIVLSLIAFVPKVLISSYISDDMTLSVRNIIEILLIPRQNVWGHFWFIPVYLVLSLLGALISRCADRFSNAVLIPAFLLSAVLNVFPVNVSWFGIKDITEFLLYVVLGIMFCRTFGKSGRYALFDHRISVLMIIVSSLLYIFMRSFYVKKIICLLMLYAVTGISLWLEKYTLKTLSWIGNKAFTIFIYSWPIQAVLEILILVVLKLNWYISYPAMFLGGLIGPLVICQIYYGAIRPRLKHHSFLDGMIGV